jgi:hypothetical protein
METIIVILCFAIFLGFVKWIQDTLSFRSFTNNWSTPFDNSKFRKWLDPKVSWKNKHEWFKDNKFLTWLFSNPLVFITDAWHFLEMIRNIAPYFLFAYLSEKWWITGFFLIHVFIFHFLFTYTNKRTKK